MLCLKSNFVPEPRNLNDSQIVEPAKTVQEKIADAQQRQLDLAADLESLQMRAQGLENDKQTINAQFVYAEEQTAKNFKEFDKYKTLSDILEDESKNFDYNIQEILLNPISVKITHSLAAAEAGNPQHLLSREQTGASKWVVSGFKNIENGVWVTIEFQQPILIRGYGVQRGDNDMQDQPTDPKFWEFAGVDQCGQDQGEQWIPVHRVREARWRSKWEVQKFDIKPTLFSKIKLNVLGNHGGDNLEIGGLRIYC